MSRNDTTYKVEVRACGHPFADAQGKIIGNEWQEMELYKSPTGPNISAEDRMCYTLGFYAAVSLAAQWMSFYPWSGETRLVPYRRSIKMEMHRLEEEAASVEDAWISRRRDAYP
jgi:hypothetical protein